MGKSVESGEVRKESSGQTGHGKGYYSYKQRIRLTEERVTESRGESIRTENTTRMWSPTS